MKSLIDSLLRVFVAALLAGATVVAVASDARGEYTVYGVGIDSCGKLIESYNKDIRLYRRAEDWITGYVSATGLRVSTQKSIGKVADLAGMMLIIRQHCRNNPLNDLATATEAMVRQVLEKADE